MLHRGLQKLYYNIVIVWIGQPQRPRVSGIPLRRLFKDIDSPLECLSKCTKGTGVHSLFQWFSAAAAVAITVAVASPIHFKTARKEYPTHGFVHYAGLERLSKGALSHTRRTLYDNQVHPAVGGLDCSEEALLHQRQGFVDFGTLWGRDNLARRIDKVTACLLY